MMKSVTILPQFGRVTSELKDDCFLPFTNGLIGCRLSSSLRKTFIRVLPAIVFLFTILAFLLIERSPHANYVNEPLKHITKFAVSARYQIGITQKPLEAQSQALESQLLELEPRTQVRCIFAVLTVAHKTESRHAIRTAYHKMLSAHPFYQADVAKVVFVVGKPENETQYDPHVSFFGFHFCSSRCSFTAFVLGDSAKI